MSKTTIKSKVDKMIDSQGARKKAFSLPKIEWEELLRELKPVNCQEYFLNPIESNNGKHCIFYRRTAIYIKTED